MNKGTIEFDLSTPEGRQAMNLCLNSQKLISALWDIQEAMHAGFKRTQERKEIVEILKEISHLID